MKYTFHLIGNSHLDPVWQWDWREGLNEALVTVNTMLDLMDEIPDLTYVRGETVLYEHIEREEPKTFARILRQIRAGRWDPIGGAYLQPDTNLPATETFARHYLYGQRYFAEKFGKPATVAWAADSFGHSAGLPEIMAGAGFKYFSFFRPSPEQRALPASAFWWEGTAGSRILAYRPINGWYGCERSEMPNRLNGFLTAAAKQPYRNIAVYYGTGNHGGGPTRRLVQDIRTWAAAHPEVEVVHSGLHRFFAALAREVAARPANAVPVVRDELGYCQRGCYASAARLKFAYRLAESTLLRAETTATAAKLAAPKAQTPELGASWRGLLFNSFHDILPGSSIERAMEEQVDWTRGVLHTARATEFDALNALAREVDTTIPAVAPDHPTAVPVLVWNPHPHDYEGPIELETNLDYRPIFAYENRAAAVPIEVRGPDGRARSFQRIKPEHTFLTHIPWRVRVLTHGRVPALGWSVFNVAWVEGTQAPAVRGGTTAPRPGEISNGRYRVQARIGGKGVALFAGARALLARGGLGAITVEDAFGSWGGCYDEPGSDHFVTLRHAWKVTGVETLETGPLRAALWVRLEGGKSQLDLFFRVGRDRDAIDVEARLLWNETRARLKLVFPGAGDQATYEVPGGIVERGPGGEVPGGRWVKVRRGRHTLGFASDALYGFDASEGTFRATVVRSSRWAFDARDTAATPEWLPVADRGEYRFNFLLTANGDALPRLAAQLEQPLVPLMVPPHAGRLDATGSAASLSTENVKLLALKPAEDGKGLIVRVQEIAGRRTTVRLKLAQRTYALGTLAPHSLATFRIQGRRAQPVSIAER